MTNPQHEITTNTKEQMLMENLVAAMTSGIRHLGANYKLPESMALEYGRLCYNQGVRDVIKLLENLDLGEPDLYQRISTKIMSKRAA